MDMQERFSVGTVLSKTFDFYFRLFGVLFVGALMVLVPLNYLLSFVVSELESGLFVLLLLLVVPLLATALVQAFAVNAVSDLQDGVPDFSRAELFRQAARVAGPVALGSILLGLGVAVGLILLVIPGLIALTFWAVVVPVLVVERPGVIRAFGRSVKLVRGQAWTVFGIGILAFLIVIVAGILVGIVANLVNIEELIGTPLTEALIDALFTPFAAVGLSILYFELRRLESSTTSGTDEWGEPTAP